MKFFRVLIPVFFLFSVFGQLPVQSQYAGLDTLQLRTIFEEPFLAGVRPSPIRFSPDNSAFFFTWNDSSYASKTSTYKVSLDGSDTEPVGNNPLVRAIPSPNQNRVVYAESGNLILAQIDGDNPRKLFAGASAVRGMVWSADSKKIAFIYEGDIWSVEIESGLVQRITQKSDDEPDFSVRSWAMNNTKIIAFQMDRSSFWEVLFPEYVPEMVQSGASMRGQPRIILTQIDTETREQKVLLDGDFYLLNTDVSANGRYFVADYINHTMKNRFIVMYDFTNGNSRALYSEITDGWFHSPLLRTRFAPEGEQLFFTSEDTGWAHIYVVRPDGSRLNRVTSGSHEVSWAEWIDGSNIVYASNERDTGLRDVYSVNANTFTTNRLTRTDGYRYDFRLSHDRRYLAYMSTTWNKPGELYLIDLRRPRTEVRLTNSIPERFNDIVWQQPDYIHFTGRDESTRITMDKLRPHNMEAGQKYPVVVFVHGAGSLQNVFQGWSISYHREYMFHQYLNKHGYVVVEVDYRHSTGYGRKFREDVTNWMGKYELEDILDGLNYLNRQHGYLDMDRVGIYGGSYGGFMALYALSHAPETFKAGAALRAVTNWVNYYYANPGYTRPRLGDPENNPEHFHRSSPISFADSLSRPAIILHGLIDDNVGFQDAAQYIDRLIQSGNTNFEMMMYPSERHSYVQPNSWHDQYLRIFNFFEKHLK
jgi:dipeptidyl aminopeptidase/acylaminoacyl peptidase